MLNSKLVLLLCTLTVSLLISLPAVADLVINEIMYNSSFANDVEYIELYNTGPTSINVNGWYLLDSNLSHPPCALAGDIGAGQYLVIAADNALFTAQYPEVINYNANDFDPAGQGFGLGNGGDTVNLFDDDDDLYDFVIYDDGGAWPSSPDGSGPSLELINPLMDNNTGASWDPSVATGGTPGAVNSVYTTNANPICNNGDRDIRLPINTDTVNITVTAYDEEGLSSVNLFVDLGEGYVAQPMYDDGTHGDGAAADSLFGALIPAQVHGTLVKYYVQATDDIGQTNNWPSDAPVQYRAYTVDHQRPLLVINEILASNATGITDEMGEFEDWVEIFNPGSVTVDLAGMFLTDNLSNRRQWEIPAGYSLAPGEFLTVWADNDPEDGPLHASFKLSSGGEEIGIFDKEDLGNARVHAFKYGLVAPDVSIGFKPDLGTTRDANFSYGYSAEYLAAPTPAVSNNTAPLFSGICINEFHTTSEAGGIDDWIELYNRGSESIDIGGVFISDNRSQNLKYAIAPGTLLPSGGFIVFNEVELGFSFSSGGEVIMITAADSTSGLDFYDYQQQTPDISEGRLSDGAGLWGSMSPTPGETNNGISAVSDQMPGASEVQISGVLASPNPFNPQTEIRFSLNRDNEVTVNLYDISGRLVKTLHRGMLASGPQVFRWNGSDNSGRQLSSGAYFAHIKAGQTVAVQKILLLK